MIDFIQSIEMSLNKKFFRIKSDNGTQFKNHAVDSFLTNLAISHNFSTPYTTQQNGVFERRNRSLCEAAWTMLTYANLP